MGFRVEAPDGRKDRDGRPFLVLPEGTLLNELYEAHYYTIGGMCIAYKAYHEGKTYFIKEVDATDTRRVLSLSQEKGILERINHPGIIKYHDFFQADGFCYLVLEFIEGQSLEKLISPLPHVFLQEKIVNEWVKQLYDIFDYLHSQTPVIIYRDLKPANVIKDSSGRIHLVDFGIARIYKEHRDSDTEPMGSGITASPEHYGAKQTDVRSDIYTLGATLHYLLTNGKGRGADPFEFLPLRKVNPRISERLERVIAKALDIEPQNRFQSINEMRRAHFHGEPNNLFPAAVNRVLPGADSKDPDTAGLATEGLNTSGLEQGSGSRYKSGRETKALKDREKEEKATIFSYSMIVVAGLLIAFVAGSTIGHFFKKDENGVPVRTNSVSYVERTSYHSAAPNMTESSFPDESPTPSPGETTPTVSFTSEPHSPYISVAPSRRVGAPPQTPPDITGPTHYPVVNPSRTGKPPVLEPSANPATITKCYFNLGEQDRFTLALPSGYRQLLMREKPPGVVDMTCFGNQEGCSREIEIIRGMVPEGLPPPRSLEIAFEAHKKARLWGREIQKESKPIHKGNIDIIIVEFAANHGNQTRMKQVFFTDREMNPCIVTFRVEEENYATYEDEFNRIIDSFNIESR